MSTKLLIRIVATPNELHAKEMIASQSALNRFSPDVLDHEIDSLLDQAKLALANAGCADLKKCAIELSIQLSSEGEQVRPALHVSRSVLEKLASVGAALDFDPYCD
jgi:hypothetical protein